MKLERLNRALITVAAILAMSCSKASIPKEDSANEPTVSPRPAPSVPGVDLHGAPRTNGTPVNTGTPVTAPNPGRTPSERADWAAIEQLEAQAKKLAHLEGCASSDDCRSAPVGSRGCGGPRYYLAWCSKSTDSAALYRKLEEVATAERNYNKKYQIGSTCEFRMPPVVGSAGGSCIAQ